MLSTLPSLSLNVTIRLCSCWGWLLDVTLILRLILSIYHKFIIDLLPRRYVYSILLLILGMMIFMRSSLICILSLWKFSRKIFFILLLSLVKLHFHVLLKCTNRFVAFVILICCNWNLVRLLNNCMSLLIFIDSIFLRMASLVISQI